MRKITFVVMVLIMVACFGMNSMAAEKDYYSDYELVKEGIGQEFAKMEEDDEITIISMEFKEFPTEKVAMYNVDFFVDGERWNYFVILHGEEDEAVAMLSNSEGEIEDYEITTISEVAEDYR